MNRRRLMYPQRDGQRLVIAQDDVLLDAPDEGENQRAGIDRFRPRLDNPMTKQRWRPGFLGQFVAACLDLVVECIATDAHLVRRPIATPVVVDGVQPG
jgi:hypothetical protein